MNPLRTRTVCAVGLMMLVATACSTSMPNNTHGQEPNRTISTPRTAEVGAPTVNDDTPDVQPNTAPSTSGAAIEVHPVPVDLDAVLSLLDQLLADLETSIEGVPQS